MYEKKSNNKTHNIKKLNAGACVKAKTQKFCLINELNLCILYCTNIRVIRRTFTPPRLLYHTALATHPVGATGSSFLQLTTSLFKSLES